MERQGQKEATLVLAEIDIVTGTPILDVKPYVPWSFDDVNDDVNDDEQSYDDDGDVNETTTVMLTTMMVVTKMTRMTTATVGSVAGATKLALEEGNSPAIAIQKQHCAVISFVVIIVSLVSTTVVWNFGPEQGG